eukprot:TRINITY_DN985_c0_g2_i1.p1 TRINITY_DN985_c0_g2~~TRINITY_DN985_c0_g2_i1.p1  ORF type:complete len:301 (-),score=46.70 TRINITY_DN985_c0_g2_i1:331-1233(-)
MGENNNNDDQSINLDNLVIFQDNEFEYIEKIGEGSYAEVWKGLLYLDENEGMEVAIKKFKRNTPGDEVTAFCEFTREYQILELIRQNGGHKNIIKFYGVCMTEGNLAIILEYHRKKDIESIYKEKNFTRKEIIQFGLEICEGLSFLQSLNPIVIQRDIKPSNLLLSETNSIIICDFGFSTLLNNRSNMRDRNFVIGTPVYLAPEVLEQKLFNHKIDIYSFALTFYYLLTGKKPFIEYNSLSLFKRALLYRNVRPKTPQSLQNELPKELLDLLYKCWDKHSHVRPNATEVCEQLHQITCAV